MIDRSIEGHQSGKRFASPEKVRSRFDPQVRDVKSTNDETQTNKSLSRSGDREGRRNGGGRLQKRFFVKVFWNQMLWSKTPNSGQKANLHQLGNPHRELSIGVVRAKQQQSI